MTAGLPAGTRRLLQRLTGPADPEVGCEECLDQLDRYVEAELSGTQPGPAASAMKAHLAGCPACRDDHDSLLAFLQPGGAG